MTLERTSMTSPGNNGQAPASPAAQAQTAADMFKVKGAQASSPLDFITANMRNAQPSEPAPSQSQIITEPIPEPTSEPVEDSGLDVPEPPQAAAEAQEPESEVGTEDGEVDEDPAEVNFKKLRSSLRSAKDDERKARDRAAELERELEEYKTGKKLPDALLEKEGEIEKLREYQRIVDLKLTPEYQDKVGRPLKEAGDRLEQLFAEYQIPKQALDKVRSLKSAKEQNEFLSDHFDHVGALEVKGLLQKEREVLSHARELESEPAKALDRLRQETATAQAVRRSQERAAINTVLKDKWKSSLQKISEEGVFTELIYREGDTKFNTEIVKPVITKAAQEVNKFVAMLFEDGLKTMRPEVAEFLSRMSLLGHSSAINAETRAKALQYAEEVEKNAKRTNAIYRPPAGGASGAIPSQAPRERLTPEAMSKQLSARISGAK